MFPMILSHKIVTQSFFEHKSQANATCESFGPHTLRNSIFYQKGTVFNETQNSELRTQNVLYRDIE